MSYFVVFLQISSTSTAITTTAETIPPTIAPIDDDLSFLSTSSAISNHNICQAYIKLHKHNRQNVFKPYKDTEILKELPTY